MSDWQQDLMSFHSVVESPGGEVPTPWPALIHKLSMTSMAWNISTGQLGCLSGCVPSHLLHTRSLAEHGKQKSPGFLGNN